MELFARYPHLGWVSWGDEVTTTRVSEEVVDTFEPLEESRAVPLRLMEAPARRRKLKTS